jgi:methylthioribose-1-phosphate isomerase
MQPSVPLRSSVTPLRWDGRSLFLLDQRLLPREEVWLEYHTATEVADAIRTMVVRGAPAIGVSAAFGLAMTAQSGDDLTIAANELRQARPTAVNLAWAIDRMLRIHAEGGDLTAEAESILAEDVAANRRMGQYGAELLGAQSTVLTHCNAGALATGGYGTALGVIRAAVEAGKRVAVFADETRPYLQGARLTAWELQRDGIDVTLITDSMSGYFFQEGKFDAVIVGADRIAANGDAANKIGTYTVAVLAHAHGIPFYIAAPVSTIDPHCPTGAEIPIEERSAQEVTDIGGTRMAPEGIQVRHPAFDVTPARLITAIITERGVLRAPYAASIAALYKS